MCVTSMVIDNGYRYYTTHYEPLGVIPLIVKDTKIRPELQVEFLQFVSSLKAMVKEAEIYDKVTGQPDCKDPLKENFMGKLQKLEEAILNANRTT